MNYWYLGIGLAVYIAAGLTCIILSTADYYRSNPHRINYMDDFDRAKLRSDWILYFLFSPLLLPCYLIAVTYSNVFQVGFSKFAMLLENAGKRLAQ